LDGTPIDLRPQAADMRLHDLGFRVEMELPDLLQEHCAGNDTTRISHHVFQQLEFARLKLDLPTRATDTARDQVHIKIPHAQRRLLLSQRRAAGESIQTRCKLGEGKWFCQVVVATSFQAFDAIVDAASGGEKENGSFVARAANRLDDGQPIQTGQHPVNDDDIVAPGCGQHQAVSPVTGVVRNVSTAPQTVQDVGRRLGVVLDDQNAHRLF
jgi:hypothetical protein